MNKQSSFENLSKQYKIFKIYRDFSLDLFALFVKTNNFELYKSRIYKKTIMNLYRKMHWEFII